MRRTGFSLLSLIIPLLTIICFPAVAQTSSDDQVLKTRTDLVNVGVLAKQKKTGRIVTNLIKDDFTVFEDGVQQTVSYFSQERLPLSVILLVDRAGCINAFNDRIRAATIKAFGDLRGKTTSILRHVGLRSGSLKMFVEETGGELTGAEPEKMEDTLTRMVSNIASSYSLAYLPTNLARDGKRRRIRVQLSPEIEKREGQTVLITRRSYIMAKDAVR